MSSTEHGHRPAPPTGELSTEDVEAAEALSPGDFEAARMRMEHEYEDRVGAEAADAAAAGDRYENTEPAEPGQPSRLQRLKANMINLGTRTINRIRGAEPDAPLDVESLAADMEWAEILDGAAAERDAIFDETIGDAIKQALTSPELSRELNDTEGIGGAKRLVEAAVGKDLTGQELSREERFAFATVGAAQTLNFAGITKETEIVGQTSKLLDTLHGFLRDAGFDKPADFVHKTADYLGQQPTIVETAERYVQDRLRALFEKAEAHRQTGLDQPSDNREAS